VVIKEVQLTKDRTTLGRRPYNDIVIDNLAVSGEHAVVLMVGNEVHLEDLNSTNGTYINGKAARKQILQNHDLVEVGKYKLKFTNESIEPGFAQTTLARPGLVSCLWLRGRCSTHGVRQTILVPFRWLPKASRQSKC